VAAARGRSRQFRYRGIPRAAQGPRRTRDTGILTRDVGSTGVKRRFDRPTITAGGQHCQLPGMSPHMHFRGNDMTWGLTCPDGRPAIVSRA